MKLWSKHGMWGAKICFPSDLGKPRCGEQAGQVLGQGPRWGEARLPNVVIVDYNSSICQSLKIIIWKFMPFLNHYKWLTLMNMEVQCTTFLPMKMRPRNDAKWERYENSCIYCRCAAPKSAWPFLWRSQAECETHSSIINFFPQNLKVTNQRKSWLSPTKFPQCSWRNVQMYFWRNGVHLIPPPGTQGLSLKITSPG